MVKLKIYRWESSWDYAGVSNIITRDLGGEAGSKRVSVRVSGCGKDCPAPGGFEDGGAGCEPRSMGGLQKLEDARPRAPRKERSPADILMSAQGDPFLTPSLPNSKMTNLCCNFVFNSHQVGGGWFHRHRKPKRLRWRG